MQGDQLKRIGEQKKNIYIVLRWKKINTPLDI